MAASRNTASSAASRPAHRLRELLQRPLKLELRGAQLHVVLADKAERRPEAPAGASAGEMLRRGHAELGELLRRHPETRQLMRHLAFTEAQIGRFGSRALKLEIPVPVLRKALEQFDLLLQGAPSEALACLRARIAETVEVRGRALEIDEDTETRPGSLEVIEASHSLFDEMERSWTGHVPLDNSAESPAR
ncbi:hypothetical protein [Piscinibacter sp.]|uniref:hypothetical protein n=1 Tax=Piscinibacter sp. TaxID=1903157 RepID=UPI0039E5BA61